MQSKNNSYKDMSAGFTKNKVILMPDGKTVVKTTTDSGNMLNEALWYSLCRKHGVCNVPVVHAASEQKISMQYIRPADDAKILSDLRLRAMADVLQAFAMLPSINETNNDFYNGYVKRIEKHLNNNNEIIFKQDVLDSLLNNVYYPTFSHGDFSIDNVIFTEADNLFLIDPIYEQSIFQSWMLDAAKMYFSILFYRHDYIAANEFLLHCGLQKAQVMPLVISECVRVATYKKEFSQIVNTLIYENYTRFKEAS